MKKILLILILFSCNNGTKKMISNIEIFYTKKDLVAVLALKCDNFKELIDSESITVNDSKILEKFSNILFENDGCNEDGDIRIKAIFNYVNKTADTVCVSYAPKIMYLNNRCIKFNTELERLLSLEIRKNER